VRAWTAEAGGYMQHGGRWARGCSVPGCYVGCRDAGAGAGAGAVAVAAGVRRGGVVVTQGALEAQRQASRSQSEQMQGDRRGCRRGCRCRCRGSRRGGRRRIGAKGRRRCGKNAGQGATPCRCAHSFRSGHAWWLQSFGAAVGAESSCKSKCRSCGCSGERRDITMATLSPQSIMSYSSYRPVCVHALLRGWARTAASAHSPFSSLVRCCINRMQPLFLLSRPTAARIPV
jgi:hypothetical protein